MYQYRVIKIGPKSFSFFLVQLYCISFSNQVATDGDLLLTNHYHLEFRHKKNQQREKYMNEWVGGKESYPSGSQKYKVVALSGRPGY